MHVSAGLEVVKALVCGKEVIFSWLPISDLKENLISLNKYEQKQVFMFSEQYLAAWLVELL